MYQNRTLYSGDVGGENQDLLLKGNFLRSQD